MTVDFHLMNKDEIKLAERVRMSDAQRMSLNLSNIGYAKQNNFTICFIANNENSSFGITKKAPGDTN